MSKVITPTIGSKVWYWPTAHEIQSLKLTRHGAFGHNSEPFDATVLYAWTDRCVNLLVTDHKGNQFARTSVTLEQPGDLIPYEGYASWMPYQVAQADKAPEPPAPPPSDHGADAFKYFASKEPHVLSDEPPARDDVTYTILPDGRTTVCQITLPNGFTVLGTSVSYSVEQFDKGYGEELALEDAEQKATEFQACIDKTLDTQFVTLF